MQKAKKYDWKETNLALFGSDTDKAVKKDSALHEPAWKVALTCKSPALFVWRIEKFKVVSWPKEDYGKFFTGDSYIVLNVTKDSASDQLLYDAHFWIGKYSTQDEYGTAAYKTVELDTALDDKAVQHREVQEHESNLFKKYFPQLTYLKGGCESGFRHVETKEYTPRLLHFAGDRKAVIIKEVKNSRNYLDSGDVFLLDNGLHLYQWNGKGANKDEKYRASQYLNQLRSDRSGKPSVEVLDEGEMSASHAFYSMLKDEPVVKKGKTHSDAKKMLRLSDASGSLQLSTVLDGSLNRSLVNEEDVWIIDNGEIAYVYLGESVSTAERRNALSYAHNYLSSTDHPVAAVTVVSKQNLTEGSRGQEFEQVFH